jgi:predicted nucleic acid-binding protein
MAVPVERYLQKLQNDVQEHLWDLLLIHLMEVHTKIRKSNHSHAETRKQLIVLLERAIKEVRAHMSKSNWFYSARIILILCNKILLYEIDRADIKNLKRKIIAEFIQADFHEAGTIPLNEHVNELRITYDTSYMRYLVSFFIDHKEWAKALYCWHVVKLLEPDWEELDSFGKTIKSNVPDTKPPAWTPQKPKGQLVLLDSNIIIYDFEHSPRHLDDALKKLAADGNTIGVTPSVEKEVQMHIKFLNDHWQRKARMAGKDAMAAIERLASRWATLKKAYAIKETIKPVALEEIEPVFAPYLGALETIIEEKIARSGMSKKLRKFAQRVAMMPEQGDMMLLAEAKGLLKKEGAVSILTTDQDFLTFGGVIAKKLGIGIVPI